MRWLFVGSFVVLGSGLCGCSEEATPRPEWLVTVSTDAPLPQFGDRLLVETLTSDGQLACDSCQRVLGANSSADFPISFSVVPSGKPLLLRSRLYRAGITGDDGLPMTDQLIENVGILPTTKTRTSVSVALPLSCFGVAADFDQRTACSPSTGLPEAFAALTDSAPLETGSASIAAQTPCASKAPEGMRCIPGGLFIRGDQAALSLKPAVSARPERLAHLSPYFLDESEVTVGAVRSLLRSGSLPSAPRIRDGALPNADHCTFLGEADASADDLPVNCVTLRTATEICRALGKRLPSEAEWEYAAGNTQRESEFSWGSDPGVCAHAIVARARLDLAMPEEGDATCLSEGVDEPLTGPVAGGHPLDVTDQGIHDLAGNLAELISDAFSPYDSSCWPMTHVLEDPHCDDASASTFPVTLRGGSWNGNLLGAKSTQRNSVREGTFGSDGTGFRCAADAE